MSDGSPVSIRRFWPRAGRAGILGLLAILLVAGSAGAQGSFRLRGLDGGELTDADLARGTTILVVWASWSPRCREVPAQVAALVERWGGRARIATVNFQEEPSAVRSFVGARGLAAPVFLDTEGELGRALGVTNLPALLVLRDGQVEYNGRWPGDVDAFLGERLR